MAAASTTKTNSPPPRKSTDSAGSGRRRVRTHPLNSRPNSSNDQSDISQSSNGMFSGMQDYKRSSDAHAKRRESIKEQSVGGGGILANAFNKYVLFSLFHG